MELTPLNTKQLALAVLMALMLTAIAFANIFQVPFHFDDSVAILNNHAIHTGDWAALWKFFPTRMFVLASYVWNYQMYGAAPYSYHGVSIFLHIATAINIYVLIMQLGQTPGMILSNGATIQAKRIHITAYLVALVFLVHPIQTEAVVYIWQRFTLSAAFFYLVSLNAFVKSEFMAHSNKKGSRTYLWLAVVAGIVAQFCKENAFTLPFAAVLISFIFFPHKSLAEVKKTLLRMFPLLAIALVIPMTLHYFGAQTLSDSKALLVQNASVSPLTYFATQLKVILTYLRLLVWPTGLNLDYDVPLTTNLFEISVLGALAAHLTAVYVAYSLRRKQPFVSFGILFFYLALAVESSFMPLEDYAIEHRLYLPSAGFFLAGIWLVSPIFYFRARREANGNSTLTPLSTTLLALLFFPLALVASARNEVWSSELTLWQDVVTKSPLKSRPHINLGHALLEQNRPSEAIKHLELAIELGTDRAAAYSNLGKAYASTGNYGLAEQNLNKALLMDPTAARDWLNLGVLYMQTARPEKGAACFQRASDLEPWNQSTSLSLARAYADSSQGPVANKLYQNLAAKLNTLPLEVALALTDDLLSTENRELLKRADDYLREIDRNGGIPARVTFEVKFRLLKIALLTNDRDAAWGYWQAFKKEQIPLPQDLEAKMSALGH